MRHNHKNHIGSPCRFVFDVLPNWKKPKSTSVTKIRKTALFLPKNRKPDVKKGKTGNHNGQQNRNRSFLLQNRKTDLENCQNRKTENPNVPLRENSCSLVSPVRSLVTFDWRINYKMQGTSSSVRRFSINSPFLIFT